MYYPEIPNLANYKRNKITLAPSAAGCFSVLMLFAGGEWHFYTWVSAQHLVNMTEALPGFPDIWRCKIKPKEETNCCYANFKQILHCFCINAPCALIVGSNTLIITKLSNWNVSVLDLIVITQLDQPTCAASLSTQVFRVYFSSCAKTSIKCCYYCFSYG